MKLTVFDLLPSLRSQLRSYLNCSETPSAESKTLIIRNISYDTSEEDLKDAFEDAVTCRLMTYPDSGKSKGSEAIFFFIFATL